MAGVSGRLVALLPRNWAGLRKQAAYLREFAATIACSVERIFHRILCVVVLNDLQARKNSVRVKVSAAINVVYVQLHCLPDSACGAALSGQKPTNRRVLKIPRRPFASCCP